MGNARKPRKFVSTAKEAIVARRKAFLEAFAKVGTVRAAAQIAGIERKTHNKWLNADKKYRAAFAEKAEEANERLEEEARRRAYAGTEKPVVYQGRVAQRMNPKTGQLEDLVIREYSDTLLIFLLKGAKPEKYRERFEHSGPQGGPIEVDIELKQAAESFHSRLARLVTRNGAAGSPQGADSQGSGGARV